MPINPFDFSFLLDLATMFKVGHRRWRAHRGQWHQVHHRDEHGFLRGTGHIRYRAKRRGAVREASQHHSRSTSRGMRLHREQLAICRERRTAAKKIIASAQA